VTDVPLWQKITDTVNAAHKEAQEARVAAVSAGLTAAQEIRLVAAQCVFGQTRGVHVAPGESHDDFERRLPKVLKLAALIEHGTDTVVCPDPAMHDPLRGDIAAQRDAAQKRGDAYRDLLDKARDEIAELRTGRLEAEADFEASLAREQIEEASHD
jgi:hypothetical protein